MDVAILGTGDGGRRFARGCLFGTDPAEDPGTDPPGHADDSPAREPEETRTGDAGSSRNSGDAPAVTLYGSDATAVMDTVDTLEDTLRDRAVSPLGDHLERIDGTTDLETAVGDADVAIETRAADLETVRRRLAGIEERLDRATVLAIQTDVANTTAAAAALERPERAVGLSTVSPGGPRSVRGSAKDDSSADVIEVVRADQTADPTVDAILGFLEGLGWRGVVVNDAPAGVADRLELAVEVEAMRAVEADVATPAAIDTIVREGFGHAAGPLASADRVGLDVRLATLESLAAELGSRFEPPAVLERKVEAGQLGVKTGVGFREWDDQQPVDGNDTDEI